jgi:hypothetical protein
MEALYRTTASPSAGLTGLNDTGMLYAEDTAVSGIETIQGELLDLQEKVRRQNEKNRQRLAVQMMEVRTRMSTMKNPYRNTRSIYSTDSQSASIIHLQV